MSERPVAVVHDLHYSSFQGTLLSRRRSVLAGAWEGALRALGVRRSAGAKVWPFILVVACFIPAVVAVGVPLILGSLPGVPELTPSGILSYRELITSTSVVVLAYAATVLPSLFTSDRRDRVLSLFFSTMLSPREYVSMRLLSGVLLMSLVVLGPLLLLLFGGVLTASAPLGELVRSGVDLLRVLVYGVLVCVFQVTVASALGSLTSRRVFAVGGYVALMMVPALVGVVLSELTGQVSFLALNLLFVPVDLAGSLLGVPLVGETPSLLVLLGVYVSVLFLSVLTLLVRYRRGAS